MKLIAAVDENWGIGRGNNLLISIPRDMKFFREKTKDSVVLMGRKTLESFPGGNPLKNRVNIVLTSNRDYHKGDAVIVNDIKGILDEVDKYKEKDVYVIGGGQIYKMLLPYCDTAYITKIYHSFEADTFFPDLDMDSEWEITDESEIYDHEGMSFAFITYKRIKNVQR